MYGFATYMFVSVLFVATLPIHMRFVILILVAST